MAQQTISIGSTANDGTGDSLRVAFNKINSMFTELYGETAVDSKISFSGNKISSNVSNANLVLEASGTGAIELEGIQIRDNHIEGTRSNDNLILSASGTGNIVLGAVKINGTTLSFTTGGGTVNLTTQDTNTTYSASDFNITQLAGYSDANYKNSSIDQSFIETAITNNTTFLQDIGAPSTSTTDNLTNKTQNLNTSGNISSSMTVGSSKVTIDPANERILIAD